MRFSVVSGRLDRDDCPALDSIPICREGTDDSLPERSLEFWGDRIILTLER